MLQQIATKTMKNGSDKMSLCIFVHLSLYFHQFVSATQTFCRNGVKISRPDKLFVTCFYILKRNLHILYDCLKKIRVKMPLSCSREEFRFALGLSSMPSTRELLQ